MWKWLVHLAAIFALPPMRWDISSCLDSKIRAEDETKIIVSQSFPNPIARGWSCEYKIFSNTGDDKIVIEFQHFSMTSCAVQNFTIIDDKTGRRAGPYCNTYMPPVFVSDSPGITILSYTGQTDDDMDTEGYMFTYKRVDNDYGGGPPASDYQYNFGMGMSGGMNGIVGGRPAFPGYNPTGGRRPLPPSGFGLPPSGFGLPPRQMGNPMMPQQPMGPNGVPVFGPSGQQTTVYNTGESGAYPSGTSLGPPMAPDVKSNLPGGKTEYVQPNYEKNQQERLLIDVDYTDESGWQWTVPKIIGIAAGGLCVTAILAAFIQYQLRRREKEIANKLRAQDDASSSDTSFTSFDSEEMERENARQKRRKKRKRRTELSETASSPDVERKSSKSKSSKSKKDPKLKKEPKPPVTQTTFTEKTLKNAERAIELQKLQKKLMKYT